MKHSVLRWFIVLGCGMLAASGGSTAQAQPAITKITPAAVRPGNTTEVVLTGSKLDGPLQLWTTFPARCELIGHDPQAKDIKQVVCKVTVPAGTSVGLGGVVLASPSGMTEVVPLMTDDLPVVAENGGNRAPTTPQEISLPAAVEGTSDGPTSDYFTFVAKPNEPVAIDLIAARQGADFDGVLRVLDATGKELLLLDDDAAAGADCRGVFTAPAEGKYLLELRDNRFKAGGKYRLRLGNFPLVTTPHPLGVQRGVPTILQFLGSNAGQSAPLTFLVGTSAENRLPMSFASAAGSGWSTLVASDLPTALESAAPLSLPVALHGVLSAAKETDQFNLSLAKSQRVTFTPISRSVGSPAVVTLRLLNEQGGQLAEAAITENEEESLTYVAVADGIHRLQVSDLTGRGGSDYAYRIEARLGPTFKLQRKVGDAKSKTENRIQYPVTTDGGALAIDVVAQRNGYDGPIGLNIQSARAGWQLVNSVIPAKAAEVKMFVIPPSDWRPAEIASLRIVGHAEEDPLIEPATMSTLAQLRIADPAAIYPPAWSDGLVLVSGVRPRADFYKVAPVYTPSLVSSTITLLRQIGETKFTLAMERTEAAFKDVPLTVLLPKLPPGVTAEVKRNGNGPKETYEVTLKGAKDLPAGKHVLRYFTYAELTGAGQAELSNDVEVVIADPLTISLSMAGPLVTGQSQKVKLSVARNGDDRQAVELKIKALPPGVTGPAAIALSAEQHEVEVELSAAADAAATVYKELAVTATTKAAGQDVTGESAPVTLEVKKP